jgi:deoxyribose-phosphate aldolase
MSIASTLEHTRLAADTTSVEVEQLCRDARAFGFAGVCVGPCHVPVAARELGGSSVRVVTVVGFPLGHDTPSTDARAAATALESGAHEIDMVIPIGFALTGDLETVRRHVSEVRRAAGDAILKVILETGLFAPEATRELGIVSVEAGADFLKTSTGFGPRGASEDDVRLLASIARAETRPIGVKASGGIRSFAQARLLVALGATRIGTSKGVEIAREELAGAS